MSLKGKSIINTYPLTSAASSPLVKAHALKQLKPHLPTCLPLYRRIQSGLYFDAPCLLTNLVLDAEQVPPAESEAWCIAFSDRSSRPDTECWFYGSWEDGPSSQGKEIPAEQQEEIDGLVRNVVLALKNMGVPKSIHQDLLDAQAAELNGTDDDKDHGGFSRKDYGGHATDPNIMLWGAVHERTVPIFSRLGILSYKFKTTLMPNFMFIWDVDAMSSASATRALPEGLRWGELEMKHFALVRSRTQIPRRDRTLATLPNLGIFPTEPSLGDPVSWTFVGVDGSLTTLHVEAECRGRGLAKAITTKLFKEKMTEFWEDDLPKYAHGYVIVGNKESEGMCRSLGGKADWEVFWLRVDLALVG